MKIRGLLYAWELRELGADVGRESGCGVGRWVGVAAVGEADVQVDAAGLAGEARGKKENEGRRPKRGKSGVSRWPGGSGVGVVMFAMLFQPRSQT